MTHYQLENIMNKHDSVLSKNDIFYENNSDSSSGYEYIPELVYVKIEEGTSVKTGVTAPSSVFFGIIHQQKLHKHQ